MGDLLDAYTYERTCSANIFRKRIGSLIPWRYVGIHNQVHNYFQCIHAVLSLLSVELEIPAATTLCASSYTDDALQRTEIGAAASAWAACKSS